MTKRRKEIDQAGDVDRRMSHQGGRYRWNCFMIAVQPTKILKRASIAIARAARTTR